MGEGGTLSQLIQTLHGEKESEDLLVILLFLKKATLQNFLLTV